MPAESSRSLYCERTEPDPGSERAKVPQRHGQAIEMHEGGGADSAPVAICPSRQAGVIAAKTRSIIACVPRLNSSGQAQGAPSRTVAPKASTCRT